MKRRAIGFPKHLTSVEILSEDGSLRKISLRSESQPEVGEVTGVMEVQIGLSLEKLNAQAKDRSKCMIVSAPPGFPETKEGDLIVIENKGEAKARYLGKLYEFYHDMIGESLRRVEQESGSDIERLRLLTKLANVWKGDNRFEGWGRKIILREAESAKGRIIKSIYDRRDEFTIEYDALRYLMCEYEEFKRITSEELLPDGDSLFKDISDRLRIILEFNGIMTLEARRGMQLGREIEGPYLRCWKKQKVYLLSSKSLAILEVCIRKSRSSWRLGKGEV